MASNMTNQMLSRTKSKENCDLKTFRSSSKAKGKLIEARSKKKSHLNRWTNILIFIWDICHWRINLFWHFWEEILPDCYHQSLLRFSWVQRSFRVGKPSRLRRWGEQRPALRLQGLSLAFSWPKWDRTLQLFFQGCWPRGRTFYGWG